MTFKEFKKQNNLKDFWLSFDWDIYCDIAEKAGYDPMNECMYNHYGDHQTYMREMGFGIWHENIFINDPDFIRLEQFTDESFLRDYFFDNYEVVESYNDDEYGLVVWISN